MRAARVVEEDADDLLHACDVGGSEGCGSVGRGELRALAVLGREVHGRGGGALGWRAEAHQGLLDVAGDGELDRRC